MELHLPQGWKPANPPRDPRGYHDAMKNLRRMNEKLGKERPQ